MSFERTDLTFLASIIGYVLTGIIFTISSLSYIHKTFAGKEALNKVEVKINRAEDLLRADMRSIHRKLDALILKSK